MNRLIARILLSLLAGLLLLTAGCVTAHEVDVKLKIRDHIDNQDVEDCLLLSIYSESLDSEGYWWVAEEESAGRMIPRLVTVRRINSGETIHQKGKVVMLLGPYVRGHTVGWEYWLLHGGFQPDDFLDAHLERAYEQEKPLTIHLLKEKSGKLSSDENVLDAARRIEAVGDLLPPDNSLTVAVLKLVIEQLRRVKMRSLVSKDVDAAAELLKKLRERLNKFPADLLQEAPAPPPAPPSSQPQAESQPESQPTTGPTLKPIDQPRQLLDLKPAEE